MVASMGKTETERSDVTHLRLNLSSHSFRVGWVLLEDSHHRSDAGRLCRRTDGSSWTCLWYPKLEILANCYLCSHLPALLLLLVRRHLPGGGGSCEFGAWTMECSPHLTTECIYAGWSEVGSLGGLGVGFSVPCNGWEESSGFSTPNF